MSLTLCPIDWEYEDKVGYKEALQIRIWCLDKENQPALVRIENYMPFFYFELPGPGERGGRKRWSGDDAETIYNSMAKALKDDKEHFGEYKESDFKYCKTLYYYQPTPRPMIMMRFRNIKAMNHAAAILRKGLYFGHSQIGGRVLLTEIDPVLKLLTDTNLTHTGWFNVDVLDVKKEVDKISTLENEYKAHWTSLEPSDYVIPYSPMILSYDIEVYSHIYKAFPREWATADVVFAIGCVFFRPNSDKKIKYCLLMGECEYTAETSEYTLIKVKTEKQLIYTFCDLIKEHNVDIVTGYNIVQFDNGYLDSRLKLKDVEWPEIGRLKNRKGHVKRSQWGSNAYGKKNLKKMFMPGRIVMDYYEETRRTQKWDTYTLDNAAKQILKDDSNQKIKMGYEEMFIIFDEMRKYKDKPESEERNFAMKRMKDVCDYCVRDAELPADMIIKTNWIIASAEMSNVVGVTMQNLFLGGQQIRCLSLLYREAYKNDIILDTREGVNFYYEGGKVQEPVQGYHELVITLDFASLYPSIMIGHNLGHDTLIRPEHVHLYTPEQMQVATVPTSEENDEEEGLEDKKKKDLVYTEQTFSFIDRKVYAGIIPRILVGLLAMRSKVKLEQKKYKEDIDLMWTILEKRQLAYKCSSNSIYGFCGVRINGKRPCLEVAATVTFFGRKSITTVIDAIIEKYTGSALIYGDTDSCMMKLPGITKANAWTESRKLAEFASSFFEKPLKLEPEWPSDYLGIKRKHYAKMKIDPDTNDYYRDETGMRIVEYKGLMPARRDNCSWAKDVYSSVIRLIMEGFGYATCVDYIGSEIDSLFRGDVDIDRLVISKSLGAGYANDTASMKVFSDEMAKIGKPMVPGERHKFLVLDRPDKKRVGERMMLLQAFESGECNENIDYNYYYENLLMKKLDVTMNAEYKKYADELSKLELKVRGRSYTGCKPAKLLQCLVKLFPEPQDREIELSSVIDKVYEAFGNVGVR